MNRMKIRQWVATAVALASGVMSANSGVTHTASSYDGRTNYRLEPVFAPEPEVGFASYYVKVNGVGSDDPLTVSGVSSWSSYYGGSKRVSITGSVGLAKAASPQLVVLPVESKDDEHYSYSQNFSIQMEHRGEVIYVHSPSSSSTSVDGRAYSEQLVLDSDRRLDDWITYDPKRLPADWRVFAGLDSMTISASDWSGLDAAVRYAVLDYVRVGGRLIVVTPEQGGMTPEQLELGMIAGGKRSAAVGLGEVSLQDEADFGSRNEMSLSTLSRERPRLAELIPDAKTPGFFTVVGVVAFGALIGPINLFSFTRRRRHRLFFTIPVIALAASSVFAIAVLVSDGVGGDGERMAVVALSPNSARASVFQQQSSRCGALLGASFETDEPAMILDNEVTSHRRGRRSSGGSTSNVALQVANGTSFSGDWFRSRAKQVQTVVSTVPSRNRLALVDGQGVMPESLPGARSVTNTTGTTLAWVAFVDSNGNAYAHSGQVAPGGRVELSKTTLGTVRSVMRGHMNDRFSGDVVTAVLRAVVDGGKLVAFSPNAPELCVETLESIDWDSSPAIIVQPAVAE